jgi:hypothetical protein
MQFRVATLNLEQDHKRWDARRDLINAEIGRLKPDLMAFNEVCIPLQSARGLRDAATALTGIEYNLVQQTHRSTRHQISRRQAAELCCPRPNSRSIASAFAWSNCVVLVRTSSTAASARTTAGRAAMPATQAISFG